MDNLINIKSGWQHSVLEYEIKKNDLSQDMSRAAVFEREVVLAGKVENWLEVKEILDNKLKNFKDKKDIPIVRNIQARYSNKTKALLETVIKKIINDLGVKKLKNQYLIQLLQVNYLECLVNSKLKITDENLIDDITIPEMYAIMTEIVLTNKESESLNEIKKILVTWNNKKQAI